MSIPVVISVYNRIEHFKKCLESLAANTLAGQTEVLIYMDKAVSQKDKMIQSDIAEFILSVTSFKAIRLIRRETNLGARVNILSAWAEVFRDHEKLIFMEDDCGSHPLFLDYMHTMFEKFDQDETITGISAFCYPVSFQNSEVSNYYIYPAVSAHGMGLWRDRHKRPEMDSSDFKRLLKDRAFLKRLKQYTVRHHYGLLKEWYFKNERWGDFCMFLRNVEIEGNFVFPSKTLIKNMGADGSGVHQGNYNAEKFAEQEFLSVDGDTFIASDAPLNDFENINKPLREYFGMNWKSSLIKPFLQLYFWFFGKK